MSSIPFRREIAEAIAELFGWDASPLWGEHRASIPYRELLSQLGERGYPRVSSDGAISKLTTDGDLAWDSMQVFRSDGGEELKTFKIPSLRATGSLWRWLPGEPAKDEAPEDSGGETPRQRLAKDDIEAIVKAALLHHHRYADGEVGNYTPQPAKEIADRLVAEIGALKGTAKSAVSRAFASLFGDGGHATYRNYCASQNLLLHWCIRQAGDGKEYSVGTLDAGELASESELQSRVAFRE